MGIKEFMISFIFTSILLSLLLIPSILTKPNTTPLQSHNQLTIKYPIKFAYLISASKGDVNRLTRILLALYHPNNHYLLHLDHKAPQKDHAHLSHFVSNLSIFSQFGNVQIVKKPNLVTYRGPTMLATTLHALSILLRSTSWDWFINLSASDYPLITQDDLIAALSHLPRNLNFIQHSSNLGWKLNNRAKPIIIDPALYSLNMSELIWSGKQRSLPTSFKLFTGSAWVILSRSFAEYCIISYDNLPRTLLLYYTNFISSPEGYFQTLICNSKEFKNTTINHDLHYITWDNPPRQHPKSLSLKDYRRMILSGTPFARKFKKNDHVLDKIDKELLRMRNGKFSYGLRPGPGSRRLKALLGKLLSSRNFGRQCK